MAVPLLPDYECLPGIERLREHSLRSTLPSRLRYHFFKKPRQDRNIVKSGSIVEKVGLTDVRSARSSCLTPAESAGNRITLSTEPN